MWRLRMIIRNFTLNGIGFFAPKRRPFSQSQRSAKAGCFFGLQAVGSTYMYLQLVYLHPVSSSVISAHVFTYVLNAICWCSLANLNNDTAPSTIDFSVSDPPDRHGHAVIADPAEIWDEFSRFDRNIAIRRLRAARPSIFHLHP